MRGVAFGVLIAMITSLNITISIVQGLGSSISGVAQGIVGTDVESLTRLSGGFGLPVLDDSTVVEENIFLFKIFLVLTILQAYQNKEDDHHLPHLLGLNLLSNLHI